MFVLPGVAALLALSLLYVALADTTIVATGAQPRHSPTANTAADLAQDAPALELRVRPLARAALTHVSGVDLTLVTRQPPTGLAIGGTSTLGGAGYGECCREDNASCREHDTGSFVVMGVWRC